MAKTIDYSENTSTGGLNGELNNGLNGGLNNGMTDESNGGLNGELNSGLNIEAVAGVAIEDMVGAEQTELSFLTAQYMPRPRINALLEQATRYKLVYVIAGAGYGKTQAVRQYIEQQKDAIVRWVQLTDSDNIGARYWENLTYSISFDNPDLAARLREFGFPETPTRFKQFAGIIKKHEHGSRRTFLVLDDFHMINSEQALTFAERCAYLQIPGASVIIISRKEPEINAMALFAKGQVSIVTEDELRFTENEVSDFLTQRGVSFSARILPKLMDETKGWAFAVLLLSLVLKRAPAKLDFALETMKQNVYKLMEMEAFNDFPDGIKKTMVKLSLVSNLPLSVLQNLFQDARVLREAPQLASFVWFDSFTGEDRVHPLYWEFLLSKRDILTTEEEMGTYRLAAQWCYENKFYLDAMNYFAKSRQYGRMLDVFRSYPFRLPHDTCAYFYEILVNMEADGDDGQSATMLKTQFIPLLLIGMGNREEARERTLRIIKKWEHIGTDVALNVIYNAYNNLAYIDIFDCTVTHKYDFLEYMKIVAEIAKNTPPPQERASGAFAVADVRSFACLVGEGAEMPEFDVFLDAAKQTEQYIAATPHCMYYGYYDLAACELAFYKNQPELAKRHAHRAMAKARDKKQYSIEAMAAQYLLRVSMQEGNYSLSREILRQLRAHLDNADFWNRQLLFDLFTGYFYAQIGLPGMSPTWLIMDEKEATSEIHIPVRELLVCVTNYIALGKYDQALTVLCNASPRKQHDRFALGEMILMLLSAVARINTGDDEGAVDEFEKAYAMSYGGVFEAPFVERGKIMQQLTGAALKRKGCPIPEQWMKMIARKATIYSKKTEIIKNAYKMESSIDDTIPLSERETSVLQDLYHGLSRDEIAANQYLSVNTVKKTLQSIFFKLEASNSVDAVRIAIENKLIN